MGYSSKRQMPVGRKYKTNIISWIECRNIKSRYFNLQWRYDCSKTRNTGIKLEFDQIPSYCLV